MHMHMHAACEAIEGPMHTNASGKAFVHTRYLRWLRERLSKLNERICIDNTVVMFLKRAKGAHREAYGKENYLAIKIYL